MDLHLAGSAAVVFGAARGLGHAIAKAFAAEGTRVILADMSPKVVEAARAIPDAQAEVLDVTDYPAVRTFADRTRDGFGGVDHIVYAVGVGSGKFGFPFWNLDPADWDRVLRVNLVGAVNVAHAFAPAMAEAR